MDKDVAYVFGGLGFIGSRISAKLTKKYQIHVFDNALLDESPHF